GSPNTCFVHQGSWKGGTGAMKYFTRATFALALAFAGATAHAQETVKQASKDAATHAGRTTKHAVDKTGEATSKAARKTAAETQKGAKKATHEVKKGFDKIK